MHTQMRVVKVMLAMSTAVTPDKVILIPVVTDLHTEMYVVYVTYVCAMMEVPQD
jgi:hypothetical protein